MHDAEQLRRAVPWAVRALWIVVLVFGGRSLDGALTGASDAAASATRWGSMGGWVIGVAAMAVPAVVTLTATRVIVPLAVPVAAITWMSGADAVNAALFLGTALLATIVAFSSSLGRTFVQASAYGDEDRHLLRAPLAYLLVAGSAWVVWAATVAGAGMSLARGAWLPAAGLGLLVLVGASLGLPRWHRLSRRWIVLVPIGVVVHDHVVLAETLLVRREQLVRIGLAPADTDAADLTGPAPGHAIEIRTIEPVTALIGLAPGRPSGSAIHLTGCLVAPTRPGEVLAAAAGRRLPVGQIDRSA